MDRVHKCLCSGGLLDLEPVVAHPGGPISGLSHLSSGLLEIEVEEGLVVGLLGEFLVFNIWQSAQPTF